MKVKDINTKEVHGDIITVLNTRVFIFLWLGIIHILYIKNFDYNDDMMSVCVVKY
jgi:hypothetical protein